MCQNYLILLCHVYELPGINGTALETESQDGKQQSQEELDSATRFASDTCSLDDIGSTLTRDVL